MIDAHLKDVAMSLSCDERECGPKGRQRSEEELYDELKIGSDKETVKRAIEHSTFRFEF